MGPIGILRPGRFVSADGAEVEFSEEDLARSAQAYDPTLHEAPIVVGHPEHDSPAWGWVRALRWDRRVLYALPWQLDPAFAELVRAGRYRKVSASLYRPDSPANPVPGVWYLRHVGFLGAMPPAVKGLPQVQLSGDDRGVVTIPEVPIVGPTFADRVRSWLGVQFQEEDWRVGGDRGLDLLDDDSWDADEARAQMVRLAGGDPQADDFDWDVLRRGHVIYNAAAPKLLGSYKFPFAKVVDGRLRASRRGLIAVKQRAPQADVPQSLRERIIAFANAYLQEAEMSEHQKQIETLTQERDQLAARVQELTRELAQLRAEQKRREAAQLVERLTKEGRVLPAEAAAVTELLMLAESSSVQFGEGEAATSLRKWLETWLAGLPQRVPTGRAPSGMEPAATRFVAPPGYEVDRERLALLAEAEELARTKQISLDEAVRLVGR